MGLVLFSASFGVANALEQGRIDPIGVIVEPLVEIVFSLGLGALAGFVLNQLEVYFHSRSKRMSLSVAFVLLTVGLSMLSFQIGPVHCSFSLLLVCMMTGTVFCNICPTSDELMDRLDRWVSLFAGLDSIRDCIAFPKNNSGRDVMLDAPSFLEQKQLDELHISIAKD